MSNMLQIKQRMLGLHEIRSIMAAMKNLSQAEVHKLGGLIEHQRHMQDNIENALADFLLFHPQAIPSEKGQSVLLLVGSERGFCGAFNEHILSHLDQTDIKTENTRLIVIGNHLSGRLAAGNAQIIALDGATVTEEVPEVLARLMEELNRLSQHTGMTLHGLAQDRDQQVRLRRLLPLPELAVPLQNCALQLNLAPQVFFFEALEQYLLATLLGLLYESLAAENRQRLAHMERALEHLDEKLATLQLKRNMLRQEGIIEEIEVMLSGRALPR